MQNAKIVFLFSGQGSQYRKMGQKLYENNTVFRDSLKKSDEIVLNNTGRSLLTELYEDDKLEFDDLLITHPAIVAIEIAMFSVLESMDIHADYICGNSLGEFAAAVSDDIWTHQEAIEASITQAKSILNRDVKGSMIAVLHQREAWLVSLYTEHNLFLASDNFKGHFTLSGAYKDIESFQLELEKRVIQFFRIPVKAPFHSPLIKEGLSDFNTYMQRNLSFKKPSSRFISGLTCKEMDSMPTNYFEEVVCMPTDYSKLISYLEEKGNYLYVDLGPSGTSATFVKYNLDAASKSTTFQIMTPFKTELNKLEALNKMMCSV